MKISSKIKYSILTLLTLFIIDRVSKYLASHKLLGKGVYLFKYLQFKLQTNPGIAFGIKLPQIIVYIFTMLIVTFLFYYLSKSLKDKKYSTVFLLGLVIIGALSNLLDRIIYQEVIDFIQIGSWPTFNLADAYISMGAIFFLIISIKKDSKNNL